MSEPTIEQIDRVAKSIVNDDAVWSAIDEADRNHYRHEARRFILAYLSGPHSLSDGHQQFIGEEAVSISPQYAAELGRQVDELEAENAALRAALGTIRGLAYSEAPAEELEEAQGDLRNIYAAAVAALDNQQTTPKPE